MATSASTFMEYQFTARLKTLLKWALRKRLYAHKPANLSTKQFAYRMDLLTAALLDFSGTEQELHNKLQEQSFGSDAALQAVLPVITSFNQECGQMDHQRRAFLLQLQLQYLTPDKRQHETVTGQAHTLYPGVQEVQKQARKAYMAAHWRFDTVPPKEMAPLPVCHTRAAFVTYDKKVLEEVFKPLKGHIDGPWGWRTFMDPFSKLANIPCLHSATTRHAKMEATMHRAMKRIHLFSVCPWMVGSSFQTDGIQMKLLLHTLDSNRPGVPGLQHLHKAGYTGDFKKHTLKDIVKRGCGVYSLHSVIPGTVADLQDVQVTAVDPGQVLIVDGPRALGQNFCKENVVQLMHLPEAERCSYTGEEYRVRSLQLLGQSKEALRRNNTEYGAALEGLPRRKTADLPEFEAYCSSYAEHEDVIWTEVLHVARKHHRFKHFSAVQSAVEAVAEKIAPMRDKWKRRLVFFGAASFAAARGAAPAPCKKIVRALCIKAAVIMTPEAWTSQTCPGCNKRLREGPDYRTKLCETVFGCPLHPNTASETLQRDAVGGLNIGFRGVYKSTGREIVSEPVNL